MKRWLLIALALLSVWAVVTGRVEWLALWLLGLAGGTNGYNASKSETDAALDETRQTIESGRELVEKHREEVREIEEQDFSGVPIGDLIDGANERERRRNSSQS